MITYKIKPISTPVNPRKNLTQLMNVEKSSSTWPTTYLTKITLAIVERKLKENSRQITAPNAINILAELVKRGARRMGAMYKNPK